MNALLKDELRGAWLGLPKAYTALDFFGMALGSYFLWAGATGKAPRWTVTAIGGVMFYIHMQRFFYVPQSRQGLVRLMRALDIPKC